MTKSVASKGVLARGHGINTSGVECKSSVLLQSLGSGVYHSTAFFRLCRKD